MRLGYHFSDQNPHRDKSLGITNYSRGLVAAVQGFFSSQVVSIVSKSSARPDDSKEIKIPWRTDNHLGRLASDHLHPFFVRNADVDLWHYPKGFLPRLRIRSAPVVATIHDTILHFYYNRYPQTRSRFEWFYWLSALKYSIANSDLILTISEFSKSQILEFAEIHRLRVPEVIVTYLGSSTEQLAFSSDHLASSERGRHVLAFVSPLPHKGTAELLSHWHQWISGPGKGSGIVLKLVGRLSDACAAMLGNTSSVELLPFQTEESLNQLIRSAQGVIVPSLIEGFGIPVIESYYLGAPTMVVAGTACDEVLAEPRLAFHLNAQDSFNEVLGNLLTTDPADIEAKRHELLERFSWRSVADRTVAAYRTVLAGA